MRQHYTSVGLINTSHTRGQKYTATTIQHLRVVNTSCRQVLYLSTGNFFHYRDAAKSVGTLMWEYLTFPWFSVLGGRSFTQLVTQTSLMMTFYCYCPIITIFTHSMMSLPSLCTLTKYHQCTIYFIFYYTQKYTYHYHFQYFRYTRLGAIIIYT